MAKLGIYKKKDIISELLVSPSLSFYYKKVLVIYILDDPQPL